MPDTPTRPPFAVPAFHTALLAWYREQQRDLPWRRSPSAYKTVVSEFMLQQTQVKTVLPYFAAWLKRFPDFATLAAASETEVVKAWEGLGYYSRARNLHKLARAVSALPTLPTTRVAWMELPGIGPYTSAAITSIAFGRPEACVDGNVVRILSRLVADATAFRDSASAAKAYGPLGQALINPENPGDHNQAMMELGATVCHRQTPLCTLCPVRSFCTAGQRGDAEDFPRLAAKKIEKLIVDRAWCVDRGRLLLREGGGHDRRLAQLHELPALEHLGLKEPGDARLLATKKRAITRYQITERIWQIAPPPSLPSPQLRWVPGDELDEITLSGPHRRWVRELLLRDAEV